MATKRKVPPRATRAPKKHSEQAVSPAEVRRAAERAGIHPEEDSTLVSMMRGDVRYCVSQLQRAFDDVIDLETYPEGGERDVCVLRALRRLRTAQGMLTTGMLLGGES